MEELKSNGVIAIESCGVEIDLKNTSFIYLKTQEDEYVGGLDSDGHEAKDNYTRSTHKISFEYDAYEQLILRKDSKDLYEPYGDLVTPAEVAKEILEFAEKAKTDSNMSLSTAELINHEFVEKPLVLEQIREADEVTWTNHGDVNFAENGGVMTKPNEERPNDIEFFQLQISAEGDRFAYHGTVCDINEYADNEVIMGEAAELGVSPEEYIKENPEQAAALLVENFGYGAMEFSATNKDGQGAYSMNPNDFKVSEQELAEFMTKVGLPDDVIPSFEYELKSRYGKDATEDTFKTNDWSEVEAWSHEKLMDGFEVEINDVKYGQSAELDPDRYQDTFDLRNGEFPVDEQYMNVDYGDDKELE